VFFSLDLTEADIAECFTVIGEDPKAFRDRFDFDDSDAISARYIIDRLESEPRGTVVVIDYLQLLDQKRENPDLMDQVMALKAFARDRGLVIVFISQIDRSYNPTVRPWPELADVRLPNPLDLTLFSKACFLKNGDVRVAAVG
jgi:replicative DNA helicase